MPEWDEWDDIDEEEEGNGSSERKPEEEENRLGDKFDTEFSVNKKKKRKYDFTTFLLPIFLVIATILFVYAMKPDSQIPESSLSIDQPATCGIGEFITINMDITGDGCITDIRFVDYSDPHDMKFRRDANECIRGGYMKWPGYVVGDQITMEFWTSYNNKFVTRYEVSCSENQNMDVDLSWEVYGGG